MEHDFTGMKEVKPDSETGRWVLSQCGFPENSTIFAQKGKTETVYFVIKSNGHSIEVYPSGECFNECWPVSAWQNS